MSIRLSALTFNSQRQTEMVEFYRSLGADLAPRQVAKGGQVFAGQLGALEISIFSIKKHEPPQTPNFQMRLMVRELPDILEKIRSVGAGHILLDLTTIQNEQTAIVQDPDGHSIELVQSV